MNYDDDVRQHLWDGLDLSDMRSLLTSKQWLDVAELVRKRLPPLTLMTEDGRFVETEPIYVDSDGNVQALDLSKSTDRLLHDGLYRIVPEDQP